MKAGQGRDPRAGTREGQRNEPRCGELSFPSPPLKCSNCVGTVVKRRCLSAGEHIGCPFATQEESGFEDELPAFSFLSFDPIMVAEQFTLMDAVSMFPFGVFLKPWVISSSQFLVLSQKRESASVCN